jgi:hypothetical protein
MGCPFSKGAYHAILLRLISCLKSSACENYETLVKVLVVQVGHCREQDMLFCRRSSAQPNVGLHG